MSALASSALPGARADASPARAGRPLLVLGLRGDQVALGRQHGELLREAGGYEPAVTYYPTMPERVLRLSERVPRWALPGVRAGLDRALLGLEARRPAVLRRRSRAFFAALELPPEHSRHLMVMDLLQNVVGLAGSVGIGASRELSFRAAVPACSTLAVWGAASRGGALRHARNFDFPGVGVWEQAPAVVFCTPDEGPRYGFVTTRGGDVPGVTGFNEAGITITAHTCFHRHVRFRGRAVVDLTHEIVRRARSLDDAVRIARQRPAASSWCLVVSSARERRAIALEVNARRVEVTRPAEGEPFLANANRYRHPALRRGQVAPAPALIANSDGRYRALRAAARASLARGGLDVVDLQAALASRADPDVPGRTRAAGGVVGSALCVQSVVIEPEEQVVHLSVGDAPAADGPWVSVPWSWDEEPSLRTIVPPATASRTDVADAARAGFAAFVEGVVHEGRGDDGALAQALGRAAAADPAEPTYRLLLAGARLREGAPEQALAELRAGLEREAAPFHRGQLLLWTARAAAALGDAPAALRARDALLALEHPLLRDYQRDAACEARRPLSLRKLQRVELNATFPELMLT